MCKTVLCDIRKTGRNEMAIPVESLEALAMRKPRIRFREFLLLTTMASLITAAFAIRARTASLLSAQNHALHAYRARLSVNWWEDRIKELMDRVFGAGERIAASWCEARSGGRMPLPARFRRLSPSSSRKCPAFSSNRRTTSGRPGREVRGLAEVGLQVVELQADGEARVLARGAALAGGLADHGPRGVGEEELPAARPHGLELAVGVVEEEGVVRGLRPRARRRAAGEMSLPSMGRSGAGRAPARAAMVGRMSIVAAGSRQTVPGGIWPGHRAIIGTRMPPS